jgi:uncharacterized protein (TIGR00251 family)
MGKSEDTGGGSGGGPVTAHRDGTRLSVKVTPRASRTGLAGVEADAVRVRLTAPPVEGEANRALTAFLAERLGVPLAAVRLAGGARARQKTVIVAGLSPAEVRSRLGIEEGTAGG